MYSFLDFSQMEPACVISILSGNVARILEFSFRPLPVPRPTLGITLSQLKHHGFLLPISELNTERTPQSNSVVLGFFPSPFCFQIHLCPVVVIHSPSLLHRIWIYHNVFVGSAVDSHWNCFQSGAVMNHAAVNILVSDFGEYTPFSVGRIPRFAPLKKKKMRWNLQTLKCTELRGAVQSLWLSGSFLFFCFCLFWS